MRFDKAKAQRAVDFIETLCTHTKGKWAGSPFKLMPWQRNEVVLPLFGTVKANGFRQYGTCFVEIPKKNGKSELGAALALQGLVADDEIGAEVYSAAADREQAGLIYHVAAQMVRNNPVLSKRLRVLDSVKRIVDYKTNSFYQVLSSDVPTKHGLNPSRVIFDELHAQPNRKLLDVLTEGTDAARQQQLIFIMTTAGIYDKTHICWEKHEYARKILDGIIEDPHFLAVIYGADKSVDDWEDEQVWKRVNPALGVIFDLEKLRKHFNEVKNEPARINNFMQLRLNMWVAQATRYVPMDKWDACSSRIAEDKLANRRCWAGLDLAATTDLTAYVLAFEPPDNELIPIKARFFMPEDNIEEASRRDNVNYQMWADAGYLILTPGNVVDYDAVRREMQKDKLRYDIQRIAYDPWNATQTALKMQDEDGMTMIEHRQGYKSMSEPTKETLKLIMGGRLAHGGNPILRWCADNLMVTQDPAGNVKPAKDKSTGRIDGFVAMVMALGQVIMPGETKEVSQAFVEIA